MPFSRRTLAVLLIAAVTVLTISGALLAVLVDPDRFRPEVISYLKAKTGKQIDLGHLGVTWSPLSIRLDDFGSRNPKPFPAGYFLKAKRVDVAIQATALLRRQIAIKSLVLHDPIVNVVSDPDGLWNFENPPENLAKDKPIFGFGVIPEVQITGATVLGSSLIDPSDKSGPIVFEARNVSATLRQVDFNAFSHLASSTELASSFVAQGEMKADSLRLGSIEVTNLKSKLRLLTKQISFDEVSVEADRGRATGELAFNLSGNKAHFTTNVKMSGLDVAHLLAAFPAGRGKMIGTMEGQVKLAGAIEHNESPLEGVSGTGNLTVHNGKLPGLSSDDNLRKMARFRDSKDATRDPSAFSSFSGDIELGSQRISSRQMVVAFYGVDVQCTGALGLANGGTLDYQGVAKVLKKQGLFTNIFARLLHEAKEENGKLVFPIRVSGTMQSPKFSVAE